jgi:quinol monooxygenase YgiN
MNPTEEISMQMNETLLSRRTVMQAAAAGSALLAAAPLAAASPGTDTASGVVTIIAQLRAKPGQEAALRDALIEVATESRKEEGCIAFDMHVSRDDPALFLAFERWADDAAIKAHFETPHFKAIAARSAELLAEEMDAHFARQIV